MNSRGYEDSQINVCLNTFHNKKSPFYLELKKTFSIHFVYKYQEEIQQENGKPRRITTKFNKQILLCLFIEETFFENVGGNMYFVIIYQL